METKWGNILGLEINGLKVTEHVGIEKDTDIWKCKCLVCDSESEWNRGEINSARVSCCSGMTTRTFVDTRIMIHKMNAHKIENEEDRYKELKNSYSYIMTRMLPSHSSYYLYKHIDVCNRWKSSYDNFYTDVNEEHFIGAMADRPNQDGDYAPDNFRWTTRPIS